MWSSVKIRGVAIREHALRPIHDRVAHDNTIEIIDALSGLDLNDDQEDYLEVLGTLVNEYEHSNLEILPAASPIWREARSISRLRTS